MGDSLELHSNVHVREHCISCFSYVPEREHSPEKQQERAYSKYWNLLVEKAKVTAKPLPGSEAAVTSMPILEHRRATR